MPIAERLRVVLVLLGVLAAVQLVNMITGYCLTHHGIIPRTVYGLQGIVFAPFLHGSVHHLLSNVMPLAILSWLVMSEGTQRYFRVVALISLVSGVLVWVFGRPSIHVGASGLIFGLWSYVLARAWYQRSIVSVLIAMFVVLTYSGLVFGFIPVPGVSFESHLAGALAGVLISWGMHSKTLLAKG
ncbi:MAG: rhomboid family intramembrane serine protease [Pseudomonas sp.]